MADAKISALTELAVPPDLTDEFVVVDKSDTSEAASGTDKRIKAQTLIDQTVGLMAGGPYLPTGYLYQNVNRYGTDRTRTLALTSGTLKLAQIWLPAGLTVATIAFASGSTALTTSGTGPHCWAALFNSSRAVLRQSTDVTNATWAIDTIRPFTLSSSFVTTYTGIHYLGVMVVSGSTGTQPTLNAKITTSADALSAAAPFLTGNSTTGETGTATDPASAISPVGTNVPWCAVG